MYVCICNAVTDRQIRKAIDQGASSLHDLKRELGVASCCGKCAATACRILDEHQARYSLEPDFQPA